MKGQVKLLVKRYYENLLFGNLYYLFSQWKNIEEIKRILDFSIKLFFRVELSKL